MKRSAITLQLCGLLAAGHAFMLKEIRAADTADIPTQGTTDYFVQTWQEDEGLPRNTLTGIAQTPDGYLWLGTYFGLVRFDGVRFTTFYEDVLPELVHSQIGLLKTDHTGRLWMATGKGGIIIRERGIFRVLDVKHGLPHPTVNSLCEDKSGAMWISTGDGSISRIGEGQTIETIGPLRGQQSGSPIQLVSDSQGELWFSQGNSYGQLRDGLATNVTRIAGALVHLCPSRDGGMWVSTNRGLTKITPPSNSLPADSMELPFGNYQIRTLFEDRQGSLWIGTREQGLFRVSEGVLHSVTQTKNTIREIFEDAEGSLWMLAEGGGLSKIRPRIFQVLDSRQGLPNDPIHAVCEDRNGDIWLAPQIGELARYSAAGVANTPPDTTNFVTSVVPDPAGGVWVGALVGGLLHHDGTKMERLPNQSPFRSKQIRTLFADHEGQLWIGLFPAGLARYGNDKLTWPGYYRNLGLTNQAIGAITEDKDGGLWFGTIGGNLVHLKDDRFTTYSKTNGLPGIAIGALYVDNDGKLWVGTLGGGLGCLREGQFRFASVKEGLHDNVISQMAEDDLGFLWFGSTRGIFRVRKYDLNRFITGQQPRFESIAYGKSDGLVNVECKGGYQPSVWKTEAGKLWFATSKGAIHFDPAALPLNTNPPPLVLERMVVNGKTIALNEAIELDWNHNSIEFDYTALSFVSPGKVLFRRQLLGFDSDWVEAGRSRTALYPQLTPGHYEFRFTACNNDDIWNTAPCTLAFVVKPAWWQRFWIRAAAVVTFATMVGVSVRFFSMIRVRRRLARLEQAHAVEKERTRIARDIHDDVGARLTQMAYMSDLASAELPESGSNTHRLKEIARASRQTVRALEEIVWAVNPRKDSLIHLLEYISQYANNFFQGTNIRCRQDLPANVPEWVLPSEFRHHIFLAAKEAFNNIQKHSNATEVWIRVALYADQMELTIEDNGEGFHISEAKDSRDGLHNMQNRLTTLGGDCRISSEPGTGTRLVMTVLLPKGGGHPGSRTHAKDSPP